MDLSLHQMNKFMCQINQYPTSSTLLFGMWKCTLRFRIIGGTGIVGRLETLVYINNRGGWNSRGVGN